MSVTEEVDVSSELKRALILGDLHRAEKILMNNPEVLPQTQRMLLLEQIRRAEFGTTSPINSPYLMVMASKL